MGTAEIKPMFQDNTETIDFDYCIIASGCNFGPFAPKGESLWFPTVHQVGREISEWKQFDERFTEGRRRHILQEYGNIGELQKKNAKILVTGAGFIGVEWITELEHFFKGLYLIILDFLDKPLGPLPVGAANYCSKYMKRVGIHEHYSKAKKKYGNLDESKLASMSDKEKDDYYKFNWRDQKEEVKFWEDLGFPNNTRPDKEYVCIGVKASNYFMPEETLSKKGPGGGGWILMDKTLAVITQSGEKFCEKNGYARVYPLEIAITLVSQLMIQV